LKPRNEYLKIQEVLAGKSPNNFLSLLQGRGHGWRTPVGTMGIGNITETPDFR